LDKTPLKDIAFKAIMVMPALLLQKPSRTSKSKEHVSALKRRLALWENGDLSELLHEGETIQAQLNSTTNKRSIDEISRQFVGRMSKGNVNGAIKLLSNNMQDGILPLNEDTLRLLREKHPTEKTPSDDILLTDSPVQIHSVRFDEINGDLIRQSAIKTNGGAGPSGLDGDGWRRILVSNNFETESSDLCNALAMVTKNLCSDVQHNSIESLMACRLIPLSKNPGLRPIGVGEILRRIIGKTVVRILKQDVMNSVGSLQVCAGQDAGCEAAIHSLRHIFDQNETEAVMLVDAANAFNSVNRKAFLHNVKVICPSIATFVSNCYNVPSRLFVVGGTELKSSEGTTQGDPIAMLVYAIATIPLILHTIRSLEENSSKTKAAGYADDVFGGGTIRGLKSMWDCIEKWGPEYGYYQQAEKSWLIVKPQFAEEARSVFAGTGVKITTEGKKHLGAAIGSSEYRNEFIDKQIAQWIDELTTLSKIALFAPQEAYTCFTAGYKHKFNFYMRTIPGIGDSLKAIDEVIATKLIPAISGGIIPNDVERSLFSLPPSFGGLGIPIFSEISEREFNNSQMLTFKKTSSRKSVNAILTRWN